MADIKTRQCSELHVRGLSTHNEPALERSAMWLDYDKNLDMIKEEDPFEFKEHYKAIDDALCTDDDLDQEAYNRLENFRKGLKELRMTSCNTLTSEYVVLKESVLMDSDTYRKYVSGINKAKDGNVLLIENLKKTCDISLEKIKDSRYLTKETYNTYHANSNAIEDRRVDDCNRYANEYGDIWLFIIENSSTKKEWSEHNKMTREDRMKLIDDADYACDLNSNPFRTGIWKDNDYTDETAEKMHQINVDRSIYDNLPNE